MDLPRLMRVGVCVGALMSPAIASAIQKPRPEDRVLPDFDIRNEAPLVPSASDDTRTAVNRLREQFPGLRVRLHPQTGTLRQLSAAGGPLSQPTGDSPNRAARRFLAAHRAAFGLAADDLADLAQVDEVAGTNQPLIHLVFHQIVNGIRVFGADVRVHMTRARSILAISSSTVRAHGRPTVPQVGAEQAAQLAALDVRPELGLTPLRRIGPTGNDRFSVFRSGPFKRDVQARLVFFPMAGSVRLAWRVEIEPNGFPQAYEILVDAGTGEILYRRNLYQYADGVARILQSDATQAIDNRRPDEHPAGTAQPGSPDGCPPAGDFLVRGLTQPFRDSSTVLFGGGLLAGNNSQAFRRSTGVEGVRGTDDGVGDWHFDFPFNSADSAETQAFFTLNFLHDFFYDLGFDEAAGNFQIENFGRGGVSGDSVNANVRAVGRNNANFATPPEGQKPTLNLFLWDGSGCWSADADGDGTGDLDSAYDSDIIIHEFHHGVSNRLNPTFTGSEASAIGEGGGDFFAYSLNGNTKLAEYAAPPNGIRQINGKTYADWLCLFFLFCEPHDNGEIWANTMWDVRERFRIDGVNGSEDTAIHAVHQLYVDGVTLSPPGPTMLDLRDAMLLADVVRSPSADPGGSENYCRLWTAFAGRGMGTDAQDTKDTGDNSVVADFTLPSTCTGGSVLPTVAISASQPTATEAGPVAGALVVTRTGSSQPDLVVRYTVSGTAAAADYTTLPGMVTIPAGAGETAVAVVPFNDSAVEADESVIVTLSGGAGYLVGTPNRATVTIVSDDVLPDLVVSALSAPPIAGAGASIAVSDTTLNQGQGTASSSATRFFLSRNLLIDAGDALLGGRALSGLPPGASSSGSSAITIPGGTLPGQYFLLAQADGDRSVTELQEANNVRLSSIQIGSDLVISTLTVPSSIAPDSTIVVTDSTKNQGADVAPPTVTRFYLSTNFLLDSGDVTLGQRDVAGLGVGVSNVGTTLVVVPSGLATGQYYVIALADALNAVTETQEANNTKFAPVQIGADLVISSLSGPTAAAPGGFIVVTDSTKNQGSGTAQESVTTFYLSANALLDASDAAIGNRAAPALVAGAVSAATTTVTIPAHTVAGVYYVIAGADAGGAVIETLESNNTRLIAVSIGPDLVVAGLSAPINVPAGGSLIITDTVRNQGQGQAGASATRFYLSANLSLDVTDELLGSRDVPPVSTAGVNAGSTLVTMPSTTPPGTRFLIVKADAGGAVPETQESNNVTFRPIQVTAAP